MKSMVKKNLNNKATCEYIQYKIKQLVKEYKIKQHVNVYNTRKQFRRYMVQYKELVNVYNTR